jgi:hypothetical protein
VRSNFLAYGGRRLNGEWEKVCGGREFDLESGHLSFFNEKIAHLSFMVCVSTNWRVGFTLDERRVALEGYRYLIR